jgi:Xaa-Pro aminopeptidase
VSGISVKAPVYIDPRFAPLSPVPPPELVAEKIYPKFSEVERERRYADVRAKMREKKLDCLIVMGSSSRRGEGMGNVRYLTGLGDKGSTSCYLLFPLDGEPVLLLGFKVKPSALALSWVRDMRPFSTEKAGENLAEEMTRRKLHGGRIGLVGADHGLRMPYDIYQALTENLPKAEYVDVTNMFFEMRLVKSDEEIAFIRKAARICDRGYFGELSVLRPGLTEFQLQAAIMKAMFDVGCEEPALVLVNSCPGTGPIMAIVDSYPSGRVIRSGDVVFTEITGQYGGYCAQSLHTFCLGPVPGKVEEMFDFALQLYHAVLDAMKPGQTWNEVAAVGEKKLGEFEFTRSSQFFHSLGFGAPDPDPRPRDKIQLKPGMVFSLEANPITPDGKWGVLVGNTVLITDNGAEVLNRTQPRLEVLL